MIECSRRTLRLTEAGCARGWLSANEGEVPPVWDSRFPCHGCPAGAARAGRSVDSFKLAKNKLAPICPRCTNAANRGDRRNPIVNDRLCVSCYNRDLEVKRGRNRKGGRPKLADTIGAVSCIMLRDDKPTRSTVAGVTGLVEVAIATARVSSGPMAFGLSSAFSPSWMRVPGPPAPVPVQMALPW